MTLPSTISWRMRQSLPEAPAGTMSASGRPAWGQIIALTQKVAELQAVEGYLQQSIGTQAGTATVT